MDGPKPIIFEIGTSTYLVKQFFNEVLTDSMVELAQFSDNAPNDVQFGCNQVIIVKNEESKERVSKLYKHALCLTIIEAKGLEFDDVVLFDFFNDSIASINWEKLVSYIDIDEKILTEKKISLNDYLYRNNVVSKKIASESETLYNISTMSKNNLAKELEVELPEDTHNFNSQNKDLELKISFDELCNELKLFYVAVTRAKKRLFIFDQDFAEEGRAQRNFMDILWKKLGIATFIGNETLVHLSEYIRKSKQAKIDGVLFCKDEFLDKKIDNSILVQIDQLKTYVSKTDPSEWKKLGYKFFKRNQYELAFRCFVCTGEKNLIDRAEAAMIASKAGEKLRMIEELSKKKDSKKFVENLTLEMKAQFKEAGNLFIKVENFKDSARCFFSAEEYDVAAEQFIKLEDWESTAQCYFKLEKYWEARNMFAKCNEPLREVDCLDRLGEYEKIIEIMSQDNKFLSQVERERFLRKYIQLMLDEMEKTIEESNNQANNSLTTETTSNNLNNNSQGIISENSSKNEDLISDVKDETEEDDDFLIIDQFSESFVEVS